MFNLDFKPQFYSYPLTTEEYARIKLRHREIQTQVAKLQSELHQINQSQKTEQYQLYRSRIIDKIRIMREEIKEYGQVLECHENIDASLKANRKKSVQINSKLLQSYKVESLAKQYRKAAEKNRQREKQRLLLRDSEKVVQEERNRSKHKKEFQRLFLNRSQLKHSLGQIYPNHAKAVNSSKRYEPNPHSNPQSHSISYHLDKVRLPRINVVNLRATQMGQSRVENNQSFQSMPTKNEQMWHMCMG